MWERGGSTVHCEERPERRLRATYRQGMGGKNKGNHARRRGGTMDQHHGRRMMTGRIDGKFPVDQSKEKSDHHQRNHLNRDLHARGASTRYRLRASATGKGGGEEGGNFVRARRVIATRSEHGGARGGKEGGVRTLGGGGKHGSWGVLEKFGDKGKERDGVLVRLKK